MTVRDALREGAAALAGTESPFLDASLLLAAALDTDTTSLLASSPESLPDEALARFRSHLASRVRGISVAYILGYKEFWGRRFSVDERVLAPRPDTETLVEAALKLGDAILREKQEKKNISAEPAPEPAQGAVSASSADELRDLCVFPRLRVHEACAGSGCVAISLAADRPEWLISASDLSEVPSK